MSTVFSLRSYRRGLVRQILRELPGVVAVVDREIMLRKVITDLHRGRNYTQTFCTELLDQCLTFASRLQRMQRKLVERTRELQMLQRQLEAIMAKVMENEAAVAALAVTRGSRLGDVASASNVPDLDKARAQAGRR